jgi:spermidine synthase
VELRAKSREGDYLESTVDLADPLNLVVPYTRSLYGGLFFQPKPQKVLMIGLGGAGFHRLFMAAYPEVLLQSVELDPKVVELTRERMYFTPTANSPIATVDGRQFVKRSREKWDWLILDAFRGGYVPPHLKTKEFYEECAARMSDEGVFITNLHSGTELYYADLKTLRTVFPQVILFQTKNRGNVIAFAVKYASPDMTNPARWPPTAELSAPLQGRLDLASIRAEVIPWPTARVARAKVMTDDFSPVEFLDAMEENNTKR